MPVTTARLSDLNAYTYTLTIIGYILYFIIRHGEYTGTIYPLTIGVFMVNVVLLVYSLFLLKKVQENIPELKKQKITVHFKLVANSGFIILMLV